MSQLQSHVLHPCECHQCSHQCPSTQLGVSLWGSSAINPLAKQGTAWYGGQTVAGSVQELIAKPCGLRRVLTAWAAAMPALQSLPQHWLRAGPGLCRYHCFLPSYIMPEARGSLPGAYLGAFWNNYPHATYCLNWECAHQRQANRQWLFRSDIQLEEQLPRNLAFFSLSILCSPYLPNFGAKLCQ